MPVHLNGSSLLRSVLVSTAPSVRVQVLYARAELTDVQQELEETKERVASLETTTRKQLHHVKKAQAKQKEVQSENRWLKDNEERSAETPRYSQYTP